MSDIYNVCVNRQTVALVDQWAAKRSLLQLSRRQAVCALIRLGLRYDQKSAMPAKAAPQASVGEEPVS
jgi:hypothetical protein